MELLIRLRVPAVLLAVAIVVTSCLVTREDRTVQVRFNHAAHLRQEGVSCAFCHSIDQATGLMRKAGPQLCKPCHEQQLRGPKDLDLDALFDVSGHYIATNVAKLPSDLRFSHLPHVGVTECATCHGDIANSKGIPEPTLGKDTCMGCHAERKASNECTTCHRAIDKDWKPQSHDTAWDARHGFVVRSRDDAIENRCSLCHENEQTCVACHQTNPPDDHSNYWRQRGHGLSVQIDRSRCVTCHRTDFCERCHESTRPRSHRGSFGAPSQRHCTSCHFPLQGEGCYTCHKSAPDHLGTPLPAGHHPAMNCRLCHGAGVRLPHPDNGTSCVSCHRG